jgi:hypothetical protein
MTDSRRRNAYVALIALILAFVALFVAFRTCAAPNQPAGKFTAASAHYRATISLDRVQSGTVRATIAITGTPEVREVGLEAAMPSMGHQNAALPAKRTGNGEFVAAGELFAMPGAWELTVRVNGGETLIVPITVYK